MLNRAGRFTARVLPNENWFGESGEKRTPYIGLPLEVIEGECRGEHITSYHWLSEKAFDGTIERLVDAFGWDGDLNALANGEFSFAGLECSIETEIEQYTNDKGETKTSCKVKWLNALGGGSGIKPMDSAVLSGLVARMNNRAKALAEKALKESGREAVKAKPMATVGAGADEPANTDDLPF